MAEYIDFANRIVWGAPALILILGVGIFLTVRTDFAQFRLFPQAWHQFLTKLRGGREEEGVSSFQALCTALAATVGTGNLVGVAGAMTLGGPGAIFWMWICALLGMVTKFAEATLALRYRVREKGEYLGGPMYMIRNGLGRRWQWLAGVYAFFGVIAAFGVGNATQINAVITGINEVMTTFGGQESKTGNLVMGLILGALVGMMLMGGAKRIGTVAERLVPVASCGYILLSFGVLVLRAEAIPKALETIVRGAFSPRAVTGGAVGSGVLVLRIGVSRGVFTNEAGMGTASIAHASARVDHPVEQGLMGMMEVFLDTIVICTMTALVILVSGVQIPYGTDCGGSLTTDAFVSAYGQWVTVFLAVSLCCFAFATVLGWGFYGARCAQYLFGPGAWKIFAFIQTGVVLLSAILETGVIWSVSETVNGLMAIPNLIALIFLSPGLKKLTREYKMPKCLTKQAP